MAIIQKHVCANPSILVVLELVFAVCEKSVHVLLCMRLKDLVRFVELIVMSSLLQGHGICEWLVHVFEGLEMHSTVELAG